MKRLVVEKQVLVVHGSGFGAMGGRGHLRIVFLPDEPTLSRAYASIADFLQEHYS